MFPAVKGGVSIFLGEKDVLLDLGEPFVVLRGMEHMPVAEVQALPSCLSQRTARYWEHRSSAKAASTSALTSSLPLCAPG